ncbi:hypothetical protein J1N35_044524 [Gossypium stocksii]|uniref:Uncharacterized protein n=1 Tax=Gossypium stocksii TaxID=47602 RepID=A0A9D3U9M5_9ROSI|nr:hypothetical protein J1N35_044524 [Gossypium stocksii]
MRVQFRDYVAKALSSSQEVVRNTLIVAMDDQTEKLTEKNDALKAMVTTLKEQIAELKGELTIYKVALDIKDNATKINIIANYFTDAALLRWCCRSTDEKQGITELTIAMVEPESFVELSLRKDEFESSKPKETCNGGEECEEDRNGNIKNDVMRDHIMGSGSLTKNQKG